MFEFQYSANFVISVLLPFLSVKETLCENPVAIGSFDVYDFLPNN